MAGCRGSESEPAVDAIAANQAPAAVIPDGPWWPVWRADAAATGVAQGDLPDRLELLWTFSADGSFESAAVVAQGIVLAATVEGKLYAVDLAAGSKKWEFSTDAGFVAPPAVAGDAVYIGDRDGRFHAIALANGRGRWHFDAEGQIDGGANLYGRMVVFGSQDGFLYCLAVDDGAIVWKYEGADQIRSSPTLAEGRGFVAGCDGFLHVVALDEGKQTAEIEILGPTGCTPAVVGPMAYVGTEQGQFFAVDWRRAAVAWTYEDPKGNSAIRSAAAVTPRLVIVGSRNKRVLALDRASGQPVWSFMTQGRVDSSPVVVGSRVLVGSADGRVYGLDLATGKEVWRFDTGGAVLASPAVAAERLLIGNKDGDLYCFGEPER